MKLGIISDLHVDTNHSETDPIERALLKVIKESDIDVLLIAGDLADNYQRGLAVIQHIEDAGCRVVFVAGNHDIWNIDFPQINNTAEIIAQLKEHPGCLIDHPIALTDDVVMIGDIGWYDYTYGFGKYTDAYYDAGHHFEREWKDNYYVNFNMSHIEKTEDTIARLAKQIAAYPDKKIIFVTHVVTHEDFLLTKETEYHDFINGYIGSSKYQALFSDNVEHVVMAHVHLRKNLTENGINYLCRCLGTKKSWNTDDAETEIKDALAIIEI